MKFLLIILLLTGSLVLSGISNSSFAEKGTFVDEVKYIQYLEENTALEEVRNGNLDLYYFRMPSDRLESTESRENLNVYESKGGSYSLLVNPAVSEQKFNPFSIKEVRFALNYLADRKLVVNELMAGYGIPMISNYGPFDPEFMAIIPQIESFDFRYNPTLAESMISESLLKHGAKKIDDTWHYNDAPIEITIFIRSDDPTRKAIGEIISSELQKIGFIIKKDFGDLNKTFTVVYGSDPARLQWNLYTEGWAGRSVFLRYDPVGLAHMYSPWFSNMPGFNNPGYWNYKHDKLDEITQKIYTGDFDSSENRDKLISEATVLGISESVRVFLATNIDHYVVNQNVKGVINDFGAGVPTRFTPINSQTDSGKLIIGVKQIYQGAWNPVMGFTDAYSNQIWNTLYDPDTFKDPFSGKTIPIRTSWDVSTAGPDGVMPVPNNAIIWEPLTQKWENVKSQKATSKVTFDYTFGNWHHGEKMDINDILYSLYFAREWGLAQTDNDKTFDTEFTPRAAQLVDTIVGIVPVDEDTIEVYVNYWHFDSGEIASWASLWSTTPWEITAAMEHAVVDGKVSFSRSGATSKSVNWLSLIIPKDSQLISDYIKEFKESQFVPAALEDSYYYDSKSAQSRYDAAIHWINESNHAVISNGPFYLVGYSPESRTISTAAFADDSYPFPAGAWSKYETVNAPEITRIQIPNVVVKGEPLEIPITTNNASKLHYFISDAKSNQISSGVKDITDDKISLSLSEEQTSRFDVGAGNLKLFVVSEQVLRPDFYQTSFLVTEFSEMPTVEIESQMDFQEDFDYTGIITLVIVVIIGIIIFSKMRNRGKHSISDSFKQ